ncbi:SGNH/GDSL hydrolase family protein [Streptomyces sp. NPDC006422]|uniref:SGNH/GDSL hydrolase family protein n=1 Tax=unclassified Streptomyces TaxID=2593676 RepID=UPI0033A7FDA9
MKGFACDGRPEAEPLRFAALGDSLTEGIGDPVGGGWRGWAALLADGLAPAGSPVEFRNFAAGGAQTGDVLHRQLPEALDFAPDVASVVVGVNDTLRAAFDIHAVAARLDTAYGALAGRGALLLTACLPDPGALLGLPGFLARPLARRQRAVNSVVHALSARHAAAHLHAADAAWTNDRALWSADRLHPGELGHRRFAARFHAVLADAGHARGPAPGTEADRPAPTRAAGLWWLATAGTGWVARRCTDLLPGLLALAADDVRHGLRGTRARLDVRASAGVAAALASVPGLEPPPPACDHVAGVAAAAPGTSQPREARP